MNVFLFFVSLFVCVQDASAAMDATMAYWEQVLRVLLPRLLSGGRRAGGRVGACVFGEAVPGRCTTCARLCKPR